jgi:hypothetical protein
VTRREALSHPLAIIGVLVTTASAVVFVALLIAVLAGELTNPYAGLVVFVALPALFVMGLLLIPVGVRLRRRALRRDPSAVVDWPVFDFRQGSVRRTALLVTGLTAANIIIVLLAGYGGLHWMESPNFCGQVCHTPMHPQFTAWRNGPHGRIACVTCHVGEGPKAFIHAKLAGVRQLVEVATSSYPTPIPPGAGMPAGAQAQTCAGCHTPGRAVGDRIVTIREYADDETNTETTTVLQMHVSGTSLSPRAIHWHADAETRLEYIATDETRQKIPYVKVTDAHGQVKEFIAPDTPDQVVREGERRTMDCVDCHNTVGHPISTTPERAVDNAIADDLISRRLPFVRREGIQLVKASYSTQEAADRAIEQGLRSFYRSRAGSVDQALLVQSVAAVQAVYKGNVFPTMHVAFGSYPDNLGHVTSDGCFRCHDEAHMAKDGSTISADCDYCHKQLDTESK